MAPDYELSAFGNFKAGVRDETMLFAKAPIKYFGRSVCCLKPENQNEGEIQEPLIPARRDLTLERCYYCGSGIIAGIGATLLFSPVWATGLGLSLGTTASASVQAGGCLTSCGFAFSALGWIRCINGFCNTCDNC